MKETIIIGVLVVAAIAVSLWYFLKGPGAGSGSSGGGGESGHGNFPGGATE